MTPGAPYLDSEMWEFAQSANRSLIPKNHIDPSFTRVYPKPMKVSAQYAQEHLPDLLTAASSGEEVEIEVRGQSTLVLLKKAVSAPFKRKTPRILGEGVGEVVVPEWDEWKAIDRELELEVTNHPLIPGEF